MDIHLQGMEDVQKQLERIQRGVENMTKMEAAVGSRLPYAFRN